MKQTAMVTLAVLLLGILTVLCIIDGVLVLVNGIGL